MNISLYLKKIKTAWLCYQKILRIFEVSEIDNFVTIALTTVLANTSKYLDLKRKSGVCVIIST